MNLAVATLGPGLLLLGLGVFLALAPQRAAPLLRAFPRSLLGAWLCFGSGAIWFLWEVWNLPAADFGDDHVLLFIAFAGLALLAARYAPDFLAVRGLSILVLLAAMPLLMAGYMDYDFPSLYFQKGLLYLSIVLAIWLGAQPWRLRDFLDWLFARTRRARGCGGAMICAGLLLCAIALSLGPTAK